MGNRANVVFTDGERLSPAIYLHNNGGPESIYAFLDEMDRRKIRLNDTMYESARFCHIVGDYFDSTGQGTSKLSLGLVAPPADLSVPSLEAFCRTTDMNNNGLYVVRREHDSKGKTRIAVRRFFEHWMTDGSTITEMPRKQVIAEEKAARKHEYRTSKDNIDNTFKKIRPVIGDY